MLAVIKTMIPDLSHARKRKENMLPNWACCGKMLGLDGHTSTSLDLWKRRWETFGKFKRLRCRIQKGPIEFYHPLLCCDESPKATQEEGKALVALFTGKYCWSQLNKSGQTLCLLRHHRFTRFIPQIICQRSDKLQIRLEQLLATEHWAETSDKHGWQREKMSNCGVELMD